MNVAGIVPVGPDGYPAPEFASPPVQVHTGDICMTSSADRTAYTMWIRAGDAWVQVESRTSADISEVDTLKKMRVNEVRDYFRQKGEQRNRRKRYEMTQEVVSLLEENRADLYPVIQQLWEDLK